MRLYLILFLVTFLFFGDILSSKTFWYKDMHTLFYPGKLFISSCIKDGFFPFWNPYTLCGEPLIPLLYHQILYPLSILVYIFPIHLGMDIFIFLHIFLASLFFYLLMKDQGLNSSSSLFSALSYGFGGIFISLVNIVYLCTATWSPLILLFYLRALKMKSIFYGFLGGLVLVLGFCGGAPEISFFDFLLIAFLTIAYIIHKRSIFPLRLFLLTTFITIGIGLFIFLPFLEFVFLSQRTQWIPFSEATLCSLSPFELLELIFPCFYAIPKEGYIFPYFGEKLTVSIYIGILPIIFTISVISKAQKNILFWGFIFVLSLFIALGSNTPFYYFLYKYIPGFDIIRYPVKALHLTSLSASYLAGMGFYFFNQSHKKDISKRFILLSLLFILLFYLFYYKNPYVFSLLSYIVKGLYAPSYRIEKCDLFIWYSFVTTNFLMVAFILLFAGILIHFFHKYKLHLIYLKVSLIVITIFDLYTFNGNLNYLKDEVFYQKLPGIVKILKNGYTRFVLTPASKDEIEKYGIEDYISREILWGSQHLPFRLFNAMGYETIFISRLLDFANKMPMDIFLKVMGIKYIVSIFPLAENDIKFYWKNGPIYVYKYSPFMNRALFIPRSKIIEKEKVLDYMKSPNFKPEEEVVLEEKPKENQKSKIKNQNCGEDLVKIVRYEPNRVVCEVDTENSGFLFLSDTYYPGWKAYVQGKETKVYRANYCFRAIQIDKGKQIVEFKYFPKTFIIGLIGSIVSFILIGIFFSLKSALLPRID